MFDNLKSMAQKGKDSLVSKVVKKIINHKLSNKVPDAKLKILEIDSQNKNITATIFLPELGKALKIEALGYKITTKNDKHFLEIDDIVKSQEWENHYIDGKRYKIPPEIVQVAEIIL